MSRLVRPVVATLALSALLGLTGCGGGDNSKKAAPTPSIKIIPKADYIAQGDAICKDVSTRLDALQSPTSENDGKALAAYLRQGAGIAEEVPNKLDGLGRPDADAPTIDTIIAEMRQQVGKAREIADVYDKGDLQAGNAQITAQDSASNKLKSDAKAFGFQTCGT